MGGLFSDENCLVSVTVVLDCHPFFTSPVILLGYLIKTCSVWIVRELVGPGKGVEERWLA